MDVSITNDGLVVKHPHFNVYISAGSDGVTTSVTDSSSDAPKPAATIPAEPPRLFGLLAPDAITASSSTVGYEPDNVAEPLDDKFWVSEVDTGKEEWIMFEYNDPVFMQELYCVFSAGCADNCRVECSNNNRDWDSLLAFDKSKFIANDNSYMFYDSKLFPKSRYTYVRIVSKPMKCLNFDCIHIYGTK